MTETRNAEAAPMLTVPLYRLAHSRTGDKGNRSNLSVIAWHPALWDVLVQQVTEEAVARHFATRQPSRVARYLLPQLHAMNLVLDDVLDEAAALSDAAIRGKDLFFGEKMECFHCHAGFDLTDAVSFAGARRDPIASGAWASSLTLASCCHSGFTTWVPSCSARRRLPRSRCMPASTCRDSTNGRLAARKPCRFRTNWPLSARFPRRAGHPWRWSSITRATGRR